MIAVRKTFANLFGRASSDPDPLADVDVEADHIGVYKLVVRDVETTTPWGKETVSGYTPKPPMTNGAGFLMSRAFDKLEAEVDPADHVGEVVGTVAIDLNEWDYTVWKEVD